MSGRCKDCKHYDTESSNAPTCNCPKFHFGYHIKLSDLPPDCVVIESDEGWGINCGPEFGCVHFEAKKDDLPRQT